MRTTIYLATACGLAVIQGDDESWVGEVCLNDKQIQCVAADRTRKGIVYCGTFGDGMFRSIGFAIVRSLGTIPNRAESIR